MKFSDYIVYVDESGDHGLSSVDPAYPVFVLAFCIVHKRDYVHCIVPALQRFKFDWFGHDLVILHEHDILKRKHPFGFLQYDDLRDRFMAGLSKVMADSPMTIVAAIVRKEQLKQRDGQPYSPYQLALSFCFEKAWDFLATRQPPGMTVHIVCESRSPREKPGLGREDRELEFRRIVQGAHPMRSSVRDMRGFNLVFAGKQANSTGLQIADLVARPIGLSVLRPSQPNRAFEIIQQKIWKGSVEGQLDGLKVFP